MQTYNNFTRIEEDPVGFKIWKEENIRYIQDIIGNDGNCLHKQGIKDIPT